MHHLIEIIDDTERKPFLGGFIDTSKGKEYHNASVNTRFLPKSLVNRNVVIETPTQTALDVKHKIVETTCQASTQTPVRGINLLEPQHTFVAGGKLREIKDYTQQIITIQRWWKRWLRRKRVLVYLEGVQRRADQWKRENDKIQKERDELKTKVERGLETLNTYEDFEHAYGIIETERKQLLKTAKATYKGRLLRLANVYILLNEIELLRKIDMRKAELKEDLGKRRCHEMLNKLSKPITWVGKGGKLLSMESKLEQEFRIWKEIFEKFTTSEMMNVQQRKDVLNQIYELLKNHEDEEVNYIKDMITKELNLLDVGVKPKDLETLNKLIETHLYDHLEVYELRHRPRLQEMRISQLRNRIYACCECKKLKLEECFYAHARTKELAKCRACVRLENMSGDRKDYTVYRYLLKCLRKEEARLRCISPVAFIMQVEDICHLIDQIWHARSAISNKAKLEDLRLCRFDYSVDWSPWNCFLITHEEMLTHRLLDDPYKTYGEGLIKIVEDKHNMARREFKFLSIISDKHENTEEWINIRKAKPEIYHGIRIPMLSYIAVPSSHIKLNK